MGRWFFRSKKRDGSAAKRDPKGVRHRSAGPRARQSKSRHPDQPAPLTWTTPEQDFITRYGDPFDG